MSSSVALFIELPFSELLKNSGQKFADETEQRPDRATAHFPFSASSAISLLSLLATTSKLAALPTLQPIVLMMLYTKRHTTLESSDGAGITVHSRAQSATINAGPYGCRALQGYADPISTAPREGDRVGASKRLAGEFLWPCRTVATGGETVRRGTGGRCGRWCAPR